MANRQNENFISLYAQAVNALLDARAALKAHRERNIATGIIASLTTEDFVNANDYLSPADIQAALDALDRIEVLLTDFTVTPSQPTPTLAALLKFRP